MTSQAIKDILIRYGADETDFKKGQKSVNKSLYQNQSTAKALDKQFKATFDTSDITPLIKAQDHLTTALKDSQDKAQLLEYELNQVNQTSDDFDSVAYAKLEQDLAKARTQAAYLEKDLNKVNQNIDAINTGNLQDMTADMQRAARQAGILAENTAGVATGVEDINAAIEESGGGAAADAISAAVEEVTALDVSLEGLLEVVMKLPGPLKAIGGAALVAGIGMVESARGANDLAIALRDLEPTADSMGVSVGIAAEATEELTEVTGDLDGAIESVNGAMKIYGDELDTVAGISIAAAEATYLTATGMLEVEDAAKVASSAQDDFGLSAAGVTAALHASLDIIAQYPGQVDDLGDSFKEFGDTASGLGYDINELFTFLNAGLELGAMNTDQLMNMLNEFTLSVMDDSAEMSAAFAALGTSQAELQAAIAAGQGNEAIAEIVFALNNMEDQTQACVLAAQIFAGVGEEFLVPMLQKESEALTQLETAYRMNQEATSQLVAIMGGELVPVLQKQIEGIALTKEESIAWNDYVRNDLIPTLALMGGMMGFSTQELQNLVFKLQEGGFAALDFAEKSAVLATVIKVNGEAMGLTSAQITNMTSGLVSLAEDGKLTAEEIKSLNGALLEFLVGGVLTEEQTAQVTAKMGTLRTSVEKAKFAYQDANGAIGIFTQTLWDNYGAQITANTGMTEAQFEAATYQEKIIQLSAALGLNTEQCDNLTNATNDFIEAEKGSEEQIVALREMMIALTENGFKPNLEALKPLVTLFGEFTGELDGSVLSANDLTGEFSGMGKAIDPTTGELEDFLELTKDAQTEMDEAARWARDLTGDMELLGDETDDAARAWERFNTALSSTPPPPVTEAPPSRSSSYAMPSIMPTNIMPFATPNTMQMGSSPTFNVNMTINGSGLNAEEQTKAIKNALDKIWFEKGRVL